MKTSIVVRCSALVMLAVAGACTDTNIAAPAIHSASGVIVFASNREDNNYEIYKIGADGSGLTRLTHDATHNDFSPVLSPDGKYIAWQREVTGAGGGVASVEIWAMNADGSGQHVVVSNGAYNETPSWTPDDANLVFASDFTGSWNIMRVPVAGGLPTILTNDPFASQWPRVSPDGKRIVFQTNRDLNFEIYSMNLDGSDLRNLSNFADDDRFPAWTPDGAHIVWSRFENGSFDVWEMNADGTDQHVVVASPFSEMMPSVSPDGKTVVFESDRSPPSTLFEAPLSGGNPRALTGGAGMPSGSDLQPWWGVAP